MNDNDFNLDFLDELEDGYVFTLPDLVELYSAEQCEEILNSEEFENYVRLLADKNPYYVRNGFRLQGVKFFLDLLRCTEAARSNFNALLDYEGTSFETYKNEHYSECMITRDSCFREIRMPSEVFAPSKGVLEDLIGELTDANESRYKRVTKLMDEEELHQRIKTIRDIPKLFGWAKILSKK